MRLLKLAIAAVLCASILVLYNFFNERLKIKYPSGITIVQVIVKFKDGEARNDMGSGSGFFIDNKYVATNSHVVEKVSSSGHQRAEVSIFDGKDTHPAKIVGYDSDSDIALLEPLSWCDIKIQDPCFNTLTKNDIGKEVIVYPYPPSMSLINSWFDFVLNRYRRYMNPGNRFKAKVLYGHIANLEDWVGVGSIRHLSGIVPGYSGTPLLDVNNCYVGMNSKYSPKNPPVSWAISNESLQKTFKEIKERGYVQTAFLGMIVDQGGTGVYITAVIKNGPAEILSKYKISIVELKPKSNLDMISRLRIYSVNDIEIIDIRGLWRVIRELKLDGNPIRIVIKDYEGNAYTEEMEPKSRFHFLQKYSFVTIDFDMYSELMIIV